MVDSNTRKKLPGSYIQDSVSIKQTYPIKINAGLEIGACEICLILKYKAFGRLLDRRGRKKEIVSIQAVVFENRSLK